MLRFALPVAYALFLWWFSTGLILYLDRLARRTYRTSILWASGLLVLSIVGVIGVRSQTTLLGAYLGFTCGVLIWGWLEMTYFMDVITGPRKQPCPTPCGQLERFWLAIQTSLYHELAIMVAGIGLIVLTLDYHNQVATWTFIILWWMRWSAKLNLFLGVPNLNEEWLPPHLRFLTTYLAKRPINLFFPVVVTVATVVMSLLVEQALELPADSFTAIALLLTATLLALAILEHWFLILPLPDAALWDWLLEQPPPVIEPDKTAKAVKQLPTPP
ncbi:DUF3623 domain-containing protein [Rhodopseudomonas palustris]|uniref:DUF3623 domain-containing protein n=1 Tax=Thiospirillum jenense TaxID=1653858 RepID=A0A839HBM6_9GAMM|nr:putative photosynthetic complex assembly protein PuhE [Thiospirillum jenense]MBB1089734.1 DUF3623 domain-containing protein [Rhodopseudomonas palustris]MBB1124836.1 DUF3623 domain-containing protein [Thiospirillum jenense]